LDYYASKAPDSPVFGNHNVFLSEFGSPEHYHPADQNIKILNNGVDKALAWGSPYVLYWQLYDNGCDVSGPGFSSNQRKPVLRILAPEAGS